MTILSNADFLVSVVEPTRLRILNCVAAAPLFVSDLVAILELPQPTVSRHLTVLRRLGVVVDVALRPFVLYELATLTPTRGRLLRALLDAVRADPGAKADRTAALARSRASARAARLGAAGAEANAG
jgi:ArsR family transcriptional regulator